MVKKNIIGIDMGGTNVRAGIVGENKLNEIISKRVNSQVSADEVLQQLFSLTDKLIDNSIASIGIGVPGLVNNEEQLVYDVVYIPAWKKVALKKLMEERYNIPVYVENDANCFVLGEYYFGKGRGYNSIIGLTIGTGLGTGLIINKRLYPGKNGGAGEFGMIEYLDQTCEYYASGQFFNNVYKINGEEVFNNAKKGDTSAVKMYEEMGLHLGNAIKMILYALDVELIVIGGSVRYAFPYFSKTMWQQIKTFGFQKAAENVKIEVSELENSGILGAAALCYDMGK
ncbi:MAG: ROK family protein [Ginsengibacter sp.]